MRISYENQPEMTVSSNGVYHYSRDIMSTLGCYPPSYNSAGINCMALNGPDGRPIPGMATGSGPPSLIATKTGPPRVIAGGSGLKSNLHTIAPFMRDQLDEGKHGAQWLDKDRGLGMIPWGRGIRDMAEVSLSRNSKV